MSGGENFALQAQPTTQHSKCLANSSLVVSPGILTTLLSVPASKNSELSLTLLSFVSVKLVALVVSVSLLLLMKLKLTLPLLKWTTKTLTAVPFVSPRLKNVKKVVNVAPSTVVSVAPSTVVNVANNMVANVVNPMVNVPLTKYPLSLVLVV